MAQEARPESSLSLVSSPSSPSSETSYPGLPTSAGSYELSDIVPEKATNIATSETTSDDDRDPSVRPFDHPPPPDMSSRPLLLVRSSPAQGTGKLKNALAARCLPWIGTVSELLGRRARDHARMPSLPANPC